MAILEFDSKGGIREHLPNHAVHFDWLFFGRTNLSLELLDYLPAVRISGAPFLMTIVCSK